LGLTVHIGYVGDPVKPQALRLEWPGIRDWAGAGPGFQSPGAGHPHWQVDVLESLAEQNTQTESFELEPSSVVEEFGAEVIAIPIDKLLLSLTFESMHLASAARWWIAATAGQSKQHINAPSDLASLTRWLTEGVFYIQQELGRCSFR
jgi:hypothetical protein